MVKVCVFCGSSEGKNNIYAQSAKALGKELHENKKSLVYGGGKVGLMGIVADEIMRNGGKAIGIIPQFLYEKEVGHDGLTELIVVGSMHERKKQMAEMADGFIAMPGGFGTLEELAEILTWVQLGIMKKPVGLYNINGFYDSLVRQLDLMVKEGFLNEKNRKLLIIDNDPAALIKKMEEYEFPDSFNWFKKENT